MTTTPHEIKNVVLVHGAFADGSGWRGVYDRLKAQGYRVTIVQNPLTSLEDDVAATLVAVAPVVGSARTVETAPKVALAMGYDVEADLEAWPEFAE